MIRRPPRSTRTDHSFPTRRSSDLPKTQNPTPTYVPLDVASNFAFLRAGSHPEELVMAAAVLGLPAIAIADRNSLAGVVRAHRAAKEVKIQLLVGARLVSADGPEMLCFPTDRAAYGRLCRLLTLGKRRAEEGNCLFSFEALIEHGAGQASVLLPPANASNATQRAITRPHPPIPPQVLPAPT